MTRGGFNGQPLLQWLTTAGSRRGSPLGVVFVVRNMAKSSVGMGSEAQDDLNVLEGVQKDEAPCDTCGKMVTVGIKAFGVRNAKNGFTVIVKM